MKHAITTRFFNVEHGAVYQPLVEDLKRRTGAKGKNLFMPLRAALTGETHGPELARVIDLMTPERVRRRLQACVRAD